MSQPSSPTSNREELNTAKILTWARGLETFERVDFVYLLMHSLFPTELRYIHGIIDSLLKRDESLCSASVHQANDFARLSHFYESHDPQAVIAEDGLRRQFIVDLSALHPLNFYCADIFFNVLMRAELATWTFDKKSEKMLKELILITTMVARHAAFRFDNRLYTWNIARLLTQRLKVVQEMDDCDAVQPEPPIDLLPNHIPPVVPPPQSDLEMTVIEPTLSTAPVLSTAGYVIRPSSLSSVSPPPLAANTLFSSMVRPDRMVNGYREPAFPAQIPPPVTTLTDLPPHVPLIADKPSLSTAFPPLGNPSASNTAAIRPPLPPLNYASIRPKITQDVAPAVPAQSDAAVPVLKKDAYPLPHERANSVGHYQGRPANQPEVQRPVTWPPEAQPPPPNGPRRGNFATQRSNPLETAATSMPVPNTALRRNSSGALDTLESVSVTGTESSIADVPVTSAPVVASKVRTVGTFPHVYSITMPNGPRFASNALQQQPFPPGLLFGNVNNVMSCFVCGEQGHNGTICPRKQPLDPEQAEKFCPLRRDAKQYPEGRNAKSRHHGGGHGHS